MSKATLQIDATTSGLVAAFGAAKGAAREAELAIKASMGRAQKAVDGGYRTNAREASGAAAKQEAAANRVVLAFVRGEDAKRKAAQASKTARAKAETEATRIAEEEARKRGLSTEEEARVRENALRGLTRVYDAEEKRKTAIVKREEAERRRALGRVIGAVASGAGAAARGGATFAREAHGMIQDARERRAASQHTLNGAFFQAGIGGDEARGMRETLQREVATGRLRGMTLDEAAGGLMAAQTQFSVLSGANAGERQGNFSRQVDLLQFARDTYQDPGEVLRVAGMLQRQGVTGSAQMDTIRSLTGAAQAGSVELGDVVSQGLGPLMANIAVATGRLGPNATAAERSAAVQGAATRSMAVAEVGAGAGLGVRDSLNAQAKMDRAMQSPRIAGNLVASMRSRGFTADQIGQLVEEVRGPGGRTEHRFRSQDSLQTLSGLARLTGGDTASMLNLLQAGGHGTPMVLDAQQRRFIAGLTSQTSGGESMVDRVDRMRREGGAFDEGRVAEGRSLRDAEEQTKLRAQAETRDNALSENTGAMRDLSDALRSFESTNPLTSKAVPVALGVAGTVLGASGAAIGLAGAGFAANNRAVMEGRNLSGERLSTGERVARGAAQYIPGMQLVGAGVGLYDSARALSNPEVIRSLESLPDRIAQAIQGAPITATVSPVDREHAATQAPTPSR